MRTIYSLHIFSHTFTQLGIQIVQEGALFVTEATVLEAWSAIDAESRGTL
jgi:hypothetical protein